ncbi:MAG: hypothetical protein KDJ46_05575 [Rhodobiaceae bacterium]|nr:hypothetical protein [Rhodobiaceae bacterium]
MQRIFLFGDNRGIPELLARIDTGRIAALVASAIRPAYHEMLRRLAADHGVPLLIQPRFSDAGAYREFAAAAAALKPDGLICHSYAMLLRGDILALVEGRAFNVHFSLLPRHRGPNPVQWALIHGDARAGVSLHVMGEDFDNGAIVAQQSLEIGEDDTWSSLLDRLHVLSNRLLDEALPDLLAGRWAARPQDEAAALTNARITPDSLPIRFSAMSDRQVFNLIRAQVAPLAGAYLDTAEGPVRFTSFVPLSQVSEIRRRYEN